MISTYDYAEFSMWNLFAKAFLYC